MSILIYKNLEREKERVGENRQRRKRESREKDRKKEGGQGKRCTSNIFSETANKVGP